MNEEAFVYKWTDSTNGKMYIGSHKGTPDDGYTGSGKIFKRAYKKRPEAFSREIMCFGTHEEMLELEGFILEELDAARNECYYNLKNTSNGGCTSRSEESRRKQSRTQTGRKMSKEVRETLSLARKGIVFSDSHRRNIAISQSGGNNNNARSVYCGFLDKKFDTIASCAKELGVSATCVSRQLRGIRKNRFKVIYAD